jgi:hypothetical protein
MGAERANGMNRRQKARTVARESYYQPSWMAAVLALAAAVLLAWHGMAKADPIRAMPQFQAIPVPAAGSPSSRAPSEDDAAPASPACTDTMDMTPQDVQSSPFDADLVAFHGKARALRIGTGVCDDSQSLSGV